MRNDCTLETVLTFAEAELTKDVKVTFDGGNLMILTLPQSYNEVTLALPAPVLASEVRLEILSVHTLRDNGFNKLRLWKKGQLAPS